LFISRNFHIEKILLIFKSNEMLIKILYSYFTLANLTALAEKVRLYLTDKFPDNPMIVPILGNLEGSMGTSLQSVGSSTKQALTKTLREADKKRDNSYVSLRDHIDAGLRRENEAYRTACEGLWPAFEKNDLYLSRMPDGDETTAINSLLKDLSNDKDIARLEATNSVEWLQELDRDNKNFVAISKQRSSDHSVDPTVADDIAMGKLKQSLELVCSALTTLQAVNGPEDAQGAVNEVNQYIKEANASAKLSQPHKKPEETEIA
jgi:hypothetical protein